MRLRHAFVSLVGGSALVTAANLLRDVTLAAAFGAALESDVFFLAISIPVFILTVGANAYRSVVVPALSRSLALGVETFRQWSARFVMVGAGATGLVTAVLFLVAVLGYYAELPGVSRESRQLFALFFAAILPMYAGTALVELFQGPLQVTGRFLMPTLLKLGLPLGIIAGVLAFAHVSMFSVAVGGALGVLLVLPVALYLLYRDQMLPVSRTIALPPDVRRTAVSGYRALVAATLITYANPLVDQWVAGFAGPGATSGLGYASRLVTGVVGLVAGAIGQVLLIQFSRQAGAGDKAGIATTYRFLIRVMPWVGCVATLGVWLTSDFLVSLLYQRGKFDAADAQLVADLVNRYAVQLPVYWTGIAPGTLVWALSMNHVLVRIGVVLFAANVVADVVFLQLFGVQGIPLSTTVVLLISGILLNVTLHRSGHLDIPVSDWVYAAVPLFLLALSGLAIRRFDLGLQATPDLESATGALLLIAVFAAAALAVIVPAVRQYRAGGQA